MKYLEIRDRLLKMGIACFNPLEFQRIIGSSPVGARKLLERYTEKGIFSRVKNGLYVFNEVRPSLWTIANRLYQPSYISLETALSHYGMLPETVYTVTSITSKVTRNFMVNSNHFLFRKIKLSAFTGYCPISIDKETVLIAEPEKALADYLYFVFLKQIIFNERLRWDMIKPNNILKFVRIFDNKAFEKWGKNVIRKEH